MCSTMQAGTEPQQRVSVRLVILFSYQMVSHACGSVRSAVCVVKTRMAAGLCSDPKLENMQTKCLFPTAAQDPPFFTISNIVFLH